MSGRRAHRSWPFPLSARLREIGAGVELDVDVLKRFRASASSFLTESHLCRFAQCLIGVGWQFVCVRIQSGNIILP